MSDPVLFSGTLARIGSTRLAFYLARLAVYFARLAIDSA